MAEARCPRCVAIDQWFANFPFEAANSLEQWMWNLPPQEYGHDFYRPDPPLTFDVMLEDCPPLIPDINWGTKNHNSPGSLEIIQEEPQDSTSMEEGLASLFNPCPIEENDQEEMIVKRSPVYHMKKNYETDLLLFDWFIQN